MAVTIECSLDPDLPHDGVPDEAALARWVAAAVGDRRPAAHVDLRITGRDEMATLNHTWRGKDGPTNVLSFPADIDPDCGIPLLGDVALCAPVIDEEASAQGKPELDHWAHLVIHGVLHLLGFDHIEGAEARAMESLERDILATLGIPDPYEA